MLTKRLCCIRMHVCLDVVTHFTLFFPFFSPANKSLNNFTSAHSSPPLSTVGGMFNLQGETVQLREVLTDVVVIIVVKAVLNVVGVQRKVRVHLVEVQVLAAHLAVVVKVKEDDSGDDTLLAGAEVKVLKVVVNLHGSVVVVLRHVHNLRLPVRKHLLHARLLCRRVRLTGSPGISNAIDEALGNGGVEGLVQVLRAKLVCRYGILLCSSSHYL